MTMRSAAVLTCGMLVAAALSAQQLTPARPDPEQPLERLEGEHRPVKQPLAAAAKAAVERNGFVSVQVNVAAGGGNLVGDAANEPSIAVDPTAPNRMAIGWRQFDRTSSSFREAGYGYSVDGGRTWTVPGDLTPGVFRSDPVLAADREGRFYYYSLISNSTGILCDMFLSDDAGASWDGPIRAFGGDKAWIAVDATGGPGDGVVYAAWSTAGNVYGRRILTRSFDHGRTWAQPIELEPAPIWGSLAIGVDGELYVAGHRGSDRSSFVVHRSDDPFRVDAAPTFAAFDLDLGGSQSLGDGPNPVGLLGQVWIDVDRSDGPLRGRVYVLASVDPPGADPQDVHLVYSDDRGATWSAPVRVAFDDRGAWQWFGTMAVAPNGRLDVVWVESLDGSAPNVGELVWASSEDGGVTWSDPVAVSPSFDSFLGWPQQSKLGDYYHLVSDAVGADLAWAATFNGEQDVYFLRLGGRDCDRNGLADADDLAARRLTDCDANGIPDTCEVAAGVLEDADGDGLADLCEATTRTGATRLAP